jgi:hypothetical protein
MYPEVLGVDDGTGEPQFSHVSLQRSYAGLPGTQTLVMRLGLFTISPQVHITSPTGKLPEPSTQVSLQRSQVSGQAKYASMPGPQYVSLNCGRRLSHAQDLEIER